jgi:hypothetical protein
MKKENEKDPKEVKPDLKHDTMEFAAPTEGEDPLDMDDESYEEEEISAEELELIEEDDEDEAAAYVAAEDELAADEDILPEEDWTDDLPDADAGEEDHEENIR